MAACGLLHNMSVDAAIRSHVVTWAEGERERERERERRREKESGGEERMMRLGLETVRNDLQ